jgi:hypothetical protein
MIASILFPRMIRHNCSRFFMFHQKNMKILYCPNNDVICQVVNKVIHIYRSKCGQTGSKQAG